MESFAKWLREQPFKHKVVIPGNHDLFVERSPMTARALMRGDGIHFLIDEEVVIDGVKFWGSPWQPWFHDWAWNAQRGPDIAQHWDRIPKDTKVLITHGPPFGILDTVDRGGFSVGCEELAKKVIAIAPKVHVFGHIHEGYGMLDFHGIKFVNAAAQNFNSDTLNPPIVVDI